MTNDEAAQIITKMFDAKELTLPMKAWQVLAEARNALKYVDKLERRVDKAEERVKKYQKELERAAKDYGDSGKCVICRHYSKCPLNESYAIDKNDCRAAVLKMWKKEAV